jgi:hypothetical protein
MMGISFTEHLMQMGLFAIILAGPLPLGFSIVGLVEGSHEESGVPHSVLLLLTTWCVAQTFLGLILGTTQSFTLGVVLASEITIFVAGILVSRRGMYSEWVSIFRKRPRLAEPLNDSEKLIIATLALVALVLLSMLVLVPITEYNSLEYHLPTMANWYQTSSLTILEQFRSDPIGRYHFGWEVLCTLCLFPFREDFVVAFPNLIAWGIAGVSVYLLSRFFGATRTHGMGFSALTLTIPIVLEHVNGMRVDLPLASFLIATLYFGLLYARSKQLSYLGMFFASLGMVLGIKPSGIFYGLLLATSVIFLRVRTGFSEQRSKDSAPRSHESTTLLLFGLLCFFFLGGFWFLRNLIQVGNPLGYVRFGLGGLISFPGTDDPAGIHATSLASAFRLTDFSHWKILIEEAIVNLNVPFFTMAMLTTVTILVLPFRAIRGGGDDRLKTEYFIGLIVLLVGTLIIYWNTPYTADNGTHDLQITNYIGRQMRFAFPLMCLLGVVAALCATLLRIKEQVVAAAVTACSVLSLLTTGNSRLAYVFLGSAIGLAMLWNVLKPLNWFWLNAQLRSRFRFVSIGTLLIGCLMLSFLARRVRDNQRTITYDGVLDYIENNISQKQTIGYLLSHRAYLLFGEHFNRSVAYVPSESDSVSQWLDTLRRRKVDFLAVGPLFEGWKSSRELAWIEKNNEAFIRVYGRDPSKEMIFYRFWSTRIGESGTSMGLNKATPPDIIQ